MKPYIYIAVPLVVLVLVFVGGSFMATAIDTPQTKLDRLMRDKTELAQRMLNEYNAAAPRIQQAFAAATTQPAEISAEDWQTFTQTGEDEKHPLAQLKVGQRLSSDEQQIRKLSRDIANLNGEEPVSKPPPGPTEAYNNVDLQNCIKSNLSLLDKALAAVREAISMTAGSGESEVRGANQPVATRLEAILIYHKADLLRREAALKRVVAEEDRIEFEALLAQARQLDNDIDAEQSLLKGGTVPGLAALPSVSLSEIMPTKDSAEKERAKTPTGSENLWILGKLVDKLPIRKAEEPAGEPEVAEATKEDKPQKPAPEKIVKAATSQPEAPAGPMEKVPSLADRLAALQTQQANTQREIETTSKDVQALTGHITELKTRLATAQQLAKDAELKMIEAEKAGAGGVDAQTSQAFSDNYRRLSDQYRKALQEVITLKEGAIRNARSTADEPEKILRSPLAPANPSEPMREERGLTALEDDLTTLESVLKAKKVLLTEIARQIEELTSQRTAIESRVAKLKARQQEILGRATSFSVQAIVAVTEADQLEKQALDLIAGPGQQAAQRAQSAANAYQRQAQQFIRSENPSDLLEKRLTEMASDQYTAAGASSVKGDLELLAARIYVQQADDLKLHQRMLKAMKAAGVSSTPDAKQLPEGMTVEALPTCATSVDKAAEVAKADQSEAAKLAKESLASYTEAASQLKDLWAAYGNIAAAHLLLAHLPRVQGDTEDHLAQARQILSRVMSGHEKRPEYPTYRWIVDGLKTASVNNP